MGKDVDWIDLAEDRVIAGCCEHDNEPSGSINVGNFAEPKNYIWS